MAQLSQGQNAPLSGNPVVFETTGDRPLDFSAFLLRGGKVGGDADMVFYGQTSAPGVVLRDVAKGRFEIDLAAVPASVDRICLTAVVDGAGTFSDVSRLVSSAIASGERHEFDVPVRGVALKAMILCELYRRGADWKIRAVGQGFDGGLKPLAESFGMDIADDPQPTTSSPASSDSHRISLEKRMVSLEKTAPRLVSLVKKVDAVAQKAGLSDLRAKVALCLDISGSMSKLFREGKIDQLVERVAAMGYRFDDDGEIDVFLFGKYTHNFGTITVGDLPGIGTKILMRHPLEADTLYGKAMEMIRGHYRAQADFGRVPVYVMFVTDGGTQDRPKTEKQMKEASFESIFWQFMAIGEMPRGLFPKKSGRLPKGFDFLAYLDDMPGRRVDNADFFAVSDPSDPSDEELFGLMLGEFPSWLRAARDAGVLNDAR